MLSPNSMRIGTLVGFKKSAGETGVQLVVPKLPTTGGNGLSEGHGTPIDSRPMMPLMFGFCIAASYPERELAECVKSTVGPILFTIARRSFKVSVASPGPTLCTPHRLN